MDFFVYVFLALIFGGFIAAEEGSPMRLTSRRERLRRAERENELGVRTNVNTTAKQMLLCVFSLSYWGETI